MTDERGRSCTLFVCMQHRRYIQNLAAIMLQTYVFLFIFKCFKVKSSEKHRSFNLLWKEGKKVVDLVLGYKIRNFKNWFSSYENINEA
jgi:hypothetical protein